MVSSSSQPSEANGLHPIDLAPFQKLTEVLQELDYDEITHNTDNYATTTIIYVYTYNGQILKIGVGSLKSGSSDQMILENCLVIESGSTLTTSVPQVILAPKIKLAPELGIEAKLKIFRADTTTLDEIDSFSTNKKGEYYRYLERNLI